MGSLNFVHVIFLGPAKLNWKRLAKLRKHIIMIHYNVLE